MDDSRLFERTVSSAIQYSGPVFDVYSDTVELCNKKTARRDYLKHRGAVAVVPLTDNGGVIIERQFRYPQQRVMAEIPAGKLEAFDTDPLDAAKRELHLDAHLCQGLGQHGLDAEIGVTAKEFIPLGIYIPSPAILSERIYVYLARGLSYGNAHPDEDEFLDYRETPLCQLIDMIMNDRISDGKTVFGLFKAAEYLRRQEREANG